MCHPPQMNDDRRPRSQVRDDDINAVIGVLAILDGELLAGAVEDHLATKYVQRFVRSGLLESATADVTPPSVGRLTLAMSELIDRLRYSLGEYETEPGPSSLTTTHALDFPTEAAARACQDELFASALDTLFSPADGKSRWRLYVVYPELMPDPDFRRREKSLTMVAEAHGGSYRGSQGSPVPA
ncbi:conserved hypothetical protein [Nocardioides sp. AX2bis]|nr:conserved hypothetical protein [Nocardioides sp. AX2bis]